MIWGDGSSTEAIVSSFALRDYHARATENGLRFEIYEPGTNRRNIKARTPLAVLWCPLVAGGEFQWLTPELAGRDPRDVPLTKWPDLFPYVTDAAVPFDVARDVVETLAPSLTSTVGR